MRTTRHDLTNQVFGNLTVIGPRRSVPYGKAGRFKSEWLCRCACGGKEIWKQADTLIQGQSDSCGCLQKERSLEKIHLAHQAAGKANYQHGHSQGSKLYAVWNHMKQRCYNPTATGFKDYGARGIKVCQQWHSFEPFRDWALTSGYTEGLSIERNDVNGNYSPQNCTWIPRNRQAWNTRITLRLNSIYTVSSFANQFNVPYDFVWHAHQFKVRYPEAWSTFISL